MYIRLVRIQRILGLFEIVKHVEYLICIRRQNVLYRPHLAQVSYISVLVIDFTLSLITFAFYACHMRSTCIAT